MTGKGNRSMRVVKVVALSAVAGLAVSVSGQPAERDAKVKGPGDAVRQELGRASGKFNRHKRTPVPFRKFDRVDRDGKAVNPNDDITLSNGKKVKAKDAFDELDRIEQGLNAEGHSLRDDGDEIQVDDATDPEDRAATDAALKKKYKATATIISPIVPTTTPEKRLEAINENLKSLGVQLKNGAISRSSTKSTTDYKPATISYSKSWNESLGKGNFSIAYGGSYSLKGSIDDLSASAKGTADATVFGKKVNLLTATGTMASSNEKGTADVQIKVDVGGKTVYTHEFTGDNTWSKAGDKHVSLDLSAEVPIQIIAGIVEGNIRVGAKGEAGVSYKFEIAPAEASGVVTPYTKVDAYAELSLEVLQIAEAGVGGDLTLLNVELPILGSVGLDASGTNGSPLSTYLYYDASASIDLTALSGKLYAFAEVHIPFVKDKKVKKMLYEFDGYTLNNRSIFEKSDRIAAFTIGK